MYGYLKTFCEIVPSKDELLFSKGNVEISIEQVIEISKYIVKNMDSSLYTSFEHFLSKIKMIKGESIMSSANTIYYEENINDIYTLIHEFIHKYQQPNIYKESNLRIFDEANAIYSEYYVQKILQESGILEENGIDVSKEEKSFSTKRLYSERYLVEMYVFFYNVNNALIECKNNGKSLNSDYIGKYFGYFDKESVEYKSYEKFKDSVPKWTNNDINFFNEKYYLRYVHPFSYIMSLQLRENKENIVKNADKIRNSELSSSFNQSLIESERIASHKINDIKHLLEKENEKIEIELLKIEKNNLESRDILKKL